MRKTILVEIFILIVTSGCSIQKDVSVLKESNKYITVTSDAYYLSNQKLNVVDTNAKKQATFSYVVKDEIELVKAAQYTIENNTMELFYQSEANINLDLVLEMLSRLNPFDLSIKQTSTIFESERGSTVSNTYLLRIENLDKNYNENVQDAKTVAKELDLEEKSITDKIKIIHNYILKTTNYDEDLDELINRDSFSAYGVFRKHKAVCTGYSRAFMMLAKETGIPALFVVSEKMNHSWNYVYDGSAWRYIDVTWDDFMKGEDTQKYLRMDTKEFKFEGKHEFDYGEDELLSELATEIYTP